MKQLICVESVGILRLFVSFTRGQLVDNNERKITKMCETFECGERWSDSTRWPEVLGKRVSRSTCGRERCGTGCDTVLPGDTPARPVLLSSLAKSSTY